MFVYPKNAYVTPNHAVLKGAPIQSAHPLLVSFNWGWTETFSRACLYPVTQNLSPGSPGSNQEKAVQFTAGWDHLRHPRRECLWRQDRWRKERIEDVNSYFRKEIARNIRDCQVKLRYIKGTLIVCFKRLTVVVARSVSDAAISRIASPKRVRGRNDSSITVQSQEDSFEEMIPESSYVPISSTR